MSPFIMKNRGKFRLMGDLYLLIEVIIYKIVYVNLQVKRAILEQIKIPDLPN